MDDGFFGFEIELPEGSELLENDLVEASKDHHEIDLVNDETFGDCEEEWKYEDHIELDNKKGGEADEDVPVEILEKSISELVVDDDELNDPAIVDARTKAKSIPHGPQDLNELFGPASPPSLLDTDELVSPDHHNIWRPSKNSPMHPLIAGNRVGQQAFQSGSPSRPDPSIVTAGKAIPIQGFPATPGHTPFPGKPRPYTLEEVERHIRNESPVQVHDNGRCSPQSLQNLNRTAPVQYRSPMPPGASSPFGRVSPVTGILAHHNQAPVGTPARNQQRGPPGAPGAPGTPQGSMTPKMIPYQQGQPRPQGVYGMPRGPFPVRLRGHMGQGDGPWSPGPGGAPPYGMHTPRGQRPPPRAPFTDPGLGRPPTMRDPRFQGPDQRFQGHVDGARQHEPFREQRDPRYNQNHQQSPYGDRQQPRYPRDEPRDYQNQSRDYQNQSRDGYHNQSRDGYHNQSRDGYHNQSRDYNNQSRDGYHNQSRDGYHNQSRDGYHNQSRDGYHNQSRDHGYGSRDTSSRDHHQSRGGDEYASPDSLMTQREKDWVIKIQMLQLHTDNPYIDDYYYMQYKMKQLAAERRKQKVGSPKEDESPKLLLPQHQNLETRSYTPAQFEGVLGRLTASSVHNPRPVIDCKINISHHDEGNLKGTKYKQVLVFVEKLYDCLLDVDDIDKRMLASAEDAHPKLLLDRRHKLDSFYLSLDCAQDSSPKFNSLMCVRKGKMLINRVLPLLTQEQGYKIVECTLKQLPIIIRKDVADEILPSMYESASGVVSQTDQSGLAQLAECLQTAAVPTSQTNPVLTAIQNKWGLSVICCMLQRCESLYVDDPLEIDNNLRDKWSQFVSDLAEKLIQANERSLPLPKPLAKFDTLTKHMERTLDKKTILSVEEVLKIWS